MRKHGVDSKEGMELKFPIGLISWKGPRTIELEDGIVWGTDKEQHMQMLDEKLRSGAKGKERMDIIGMMNSLRSLMVREACKQDAKRMDKEPYLWWYHQMRDEKTGYLHDRIGDMLQIAKKEKWSTWLFITLHSQELQEYIDRRGDYRWETYDEVEMKERHYQ